MRQRVDRLEVGIGYELGNGARVMFAQVLGPDANGWWWALDTEGIVRHWDPRSMPYLAAPEPATPAPTWEWRQVQAGDTFMDIAGHMFIAGGVTRHSALGQYRWVAVLPQVTP